MEAEATKATGEQKETKLPDGILVVDLPYLFHTTAIRNHRSKAHCEEIEQTLISYGIEKGKFSLDVKHPKYFTLHPFENFCSPWAIDDVFLAYQTSRPLRLVDARKPNTIVYDKKGLFVSQRTEDAQNLLAQSDGWLADCDDAYEVHLFRPYETLCSGYDVVNCNIRFPVATGYRFLHDVGAKLIQRRSIDLSGAKSPKHLARDRKMSYACSEYPSAIAAPLEKNVQSLADPIIVELCRKYSCTV